MQILKKAEKLDYSNWSYEHTCHNCQSVLKIEPQDIKCFYYDGRDEAFINADSYEFKAICAACKNQFFIPEISIPYLLKTDKMKRAK